MNELREEIELLEEDHEAGKQEAMKTKYYYSKVEKLASEKSSLLRQLKSSLAANREQKAEIERLKRIVDVAKVDRIDMKAKLDVYNSGGFVDADAVAAAYLEEKSIVNRIWEALGISTYEQAGGNTIYEIVASLRASAGEKPEDAWNRGWASGWHSCFNRHPSYHPKPYVAPPTLPAEEK